MVIRKNLIWVAVAVAVLSAAGVMLGQKATPKAQDKLAIGAEEIKQLLLLMDADKNGKISKQEFMAFMEAEFDRLDTEKNGQLDPKELAYSDLRVSYFRKAGK